MEGQFYSPGKVQELRDRIRFDEEALRTVARLGVMFPEAVAYDALSTAIKVDQIGSSERIREIEALPIQLEPRTNPELVAYVGRRYNVLLRHGRSLKDVRLVHDWRGLSWQYAGGTSRNVTRAIIESVEEIVEPGAEA